MKAFFLLLLFIIPLFFLPIPYALNHTGIYNHLSGLIWCTHKIACTHEVGHKVDDVAGWVSSTQEYKKVVNDLGYDYFAESNTQGRVLSFKNDKETYAEIFTLAAGQEENMHPSLIKFYDWDLARQLLEKYQ